MKTEPTLDAEEAITEAQHADDASTRSRVARSILQHGPSTANDLAHRLGLTAPAVRRHLTVLLSTGQVISRQQRVYGHRGRGRPAKVFALTDAGRGEFYQAYDHLAISALTYLTEVVGPSAVDEFANRQTDAVEARFAELRAEYGDSAEALVEALTAEGFVASLQPVPSGVQLCQYHCPVAHVAAEFPQLCEAETRTFARLLDSHVQRLATIAHGDGVCTTHVPHPVVSADSARKKGSQS
ncbi:ArsR family transcriptional regulator [Propionicimonas paludicola]|uniref:ArsR family transcriptional regulator n=1 Tax=Propionicimonas paludicola TaxID=185243 RepID=A0A2A9CTG1_9ACTN|nr:ArsR family transcriptional regulator [Propionicimonas paludicola]PFG16930.1 ArsR family transcriptional regulator [Propionicimonas paludicola]